MRLDSLPNRFETQIVKCPTSFYETASGYKKKQEHHRGDSLSSDVYVGNCVLGTSGFSFCSTSELKTSLDAYCGQRQGSSDNGRIGEELFPPFRLESQPLQRSLEKITVSGFPIADQSGECQARAAWPSYHHYNGAIENW